MIFVYSSAASGISINMHYCMDRLISWSLSDDHAKDCPACDENKKTTAKPQFSCNGCCEDELKEVKIEKNYKAEQSFLPKFSFEDLTSTFNSNELSLVSPVKLIGSYSINDPPPQKYKVAGFIF